MSNISTDRHNLAGAKLFKDIEVPPRKLLIHNTNKKKQPHHHHHQEMIDGGEEMNNLYKFLPFNNTDDVDSDDPAESDRFRMYEFKIRRCTRSRSHDWTDCPFAHPGEKARRRDPRRYNYSGAVCSEYRRGGVCSRGDDCEFAHGVFECWLHPSRYRTEACKDGKNCKRKVCFFAHSLGQLRSFPNKNHCCCIHNHANFSSSPTSTLLGNINIMHQLSCSPSLSPPLSPAKQGYSSSPLSRLSKLISAGNSELSIMSYKDALNEMIISSLDAMSFNEVPFSSSSSPPPPPHWIDVNSTKNVVEDQQQFVLSPSTPSPSDQLMNNPFGHQKIASTSDPDLGWVNDLLK